MVSAISNQGLVRFEFIEEAMNTDLLIGFMERVIADSDRKVFLIIDNLKVHNAKLVTEWLVERKEHLEVFPSSAVLARDQLRRVPEPELQNGVALFRPSTQQKGLASESIQLHGLSGHTRTDYGLFQTFGGSICSFPIYLIAGLIMGWRKATRNAYRG